MQIEINPLEGNEGESRGAVQSLICALGFCQFFLTRHTVEVQSADPERWENIIGGDDDTSAEWLGCASIATRGFFRVREEGEAHLRLSIMLLRRNGSVVKQGNILFNRDSGRMIDITS